MMSTPATPPPPPQATPIPGGTDIINEDVSDSEDDDQER